jgi:DNA polymerase-3 subunit chi
MKVQFYILNTSDEKLISHFVCQLTEKIFKKNHRILIQLTSTERLDFYDDQLWGFNPDSYIPHLKDVEVINENTNSPIVLTCNHNYQSNKLDIILSLDSSYITKTCVCNQVLYIIDSTEINLINARKLFKTYKEKNYQIDTHKIQVQ